MSHQEMDDRGLVTRKLDGPPGTRLLWAGLSVLGVAVFLSAAFGHIYVSTAFTALAFVWMWVLVSYMRWHVRAARAQGVILDWPLWNTRADIRFGKIFAAITLTFFGALFVILVVWAIADSG